MSKSNVAPSFLAPKLAFAQCALISTTGTTLKDMVQAVAMSAIFHSVQSCNNDVGIRLVESFVDGMRKASVVAYLEFHGNFRWDKEAKALVFHKNPHVAAPVGGKLSKQDVEQMHALLSANPWYEARQEAEIVSTCDVNAMVTACVKKIQKALKKGLEIQVDGAGAEVLLSLAKGDKISVNISATPEEARDAEIASLLKD